MGTSCDFSYDRSSFCSDAINTFFSPQKAVKIDMDYPDWDGAIDIHISPFTDTNSTFEFLDSKCQFSISRYVRLRNDITSAGKVNSIFTFEHSKPQDILSLINDYLAIYDFLVFVNYNASITFSDIYISKRNLSGRFDRTATVHIFTGKVPEVYTSNDSITIDDFPDGKLGAVFSRIASLRGNDIRLRYYFPGNKHEARYIDPGKWLIMALNFEGLFSSTFPNFKCDNNPAFSKAKQLILDRIDDTSDGKQLNNKEAAYYEKCRNQVVHYEGQLEEKFNYVFKKHKDVLSNILNYNETHLGIPASENYGAIYATYRNKVAHGAVDPLTDKEVAVYRLLPPLIYILLLYCLNLNTDDLSRIICKLFR
jgi:hypothetical protein